MDNKPDETRQILVYIVPGRFFLMNKLSGLTDGE